jgi:hypothetical protein
MLKRDPNERIGIGEVWSIIDSLRDPHNGQASIQPMVYMASNPNNIIPIP